MTGPDEPGLRAIAVRLLEVPGIVGVMLGGSRARGDHTPASDVDLGLYYRGAPDVGALRALAREVSGPDAELTDPGGWGPWVDGGGWLRFGDLPMDWVYRDVDQVHAAWADAGAGRYAFHQQAGHPLGFPDFVYAGEVALGRILAEHGTELADLQRETRVYPAPLATALVERLWNAEFDVMIARKAVDRGDAVYVAACLSQALLLCAHALHARAGVWLLNEKGAVTAAGRLPGPPDFASRAHGVLAGLSRTELAGAIDAADVLVGEVRSFCR